MTDRGNAAGRLPAAPPAQPAAATAPHGGTVRAVRMTLTQGETPRGPVHKLLILLARPEGFEPPTLRFEA